MRFLIVLSVVLISVFAENHSGTFEVPDHVKEIYKKCKNSLRLTKEDFVQDQDHSKKNCLKACVLEEFGVIKKDGTYDVDKFNEKIESHFKEKVSSRALTAMKKCVEEVNTIKSIQKCNRAGTVTKCILNAFRDHIKEH